MHAADIMTTSVKTVSPDTDIREIAELLLKQRISAVPVIDDQRRVVGIVSEGDLMRRLEDDAGTRHSWWMEVFSGEHDAEHYLKTHGRVAAEVMTTDVITIAEDMSLHQIAGLLEQHHIKRAPVTRDGVLVGIVSRANLLHGLTAKPATTEQRSVDDRSLRDSLMHELSQEVGLITGRINVTVNDGTVQLWGIVYSEAEKKAAELAAQNMAGVKSVENYLGQIPPWLTEA